jgi:hypothetical protein
MPSRKTAVQKEPSLAPDRALRAITEQLDGLQKPARTAHRTRGQKPMLCLFAATATKTATARFASCWPSRSPPAMPAELARPLLVADPPPNEARNRVDFVSKPRHR